MKKLVLIMALLVVVPFYAQKRVADKVQELNQNGTEFKAYSPLTPTNKIKEKEIVNNATYAYLKDEVLASIYKNKPETIELDIPYQDDVISMQLYKVNIFANGFHGDTDREKDIAFKHGVFYRGIVKNNDNSIASFSFFEKEMIGIVSTHEHQNVVVGKLMRPENFSEYIVYSDSQLNIQNPFHCLVSDEIDDQVKTFGKKSDLGVKSTQTTRCVTLYYEVDHDMFLANLSNEELTINWLTSLFNNVQTLYANDNINIALKSFFIWTTGDPYSGTDSEDYLFDFLNNSQSNPFDGDIGQLLAEDEGGLGGLAPLNGVCDSYYNGSYVDVNDNYLEEVPVYSWSVQASTHEIGHQLGSQHTHACAWNGNNTPIDGCYTIEGSCGSASIPSSGGTIMSYCHLQSVGINFANGFGSQPGDLIRTVVDNSNCLATECVGGICNSTITDIMVSNNSLDNFSVSWGDSGDANAWEVAITELGAPNPTTWTEVTSSNTNINGLQPNTYYSFKVRNICGEGTSQIKEMIFATDADWCTGYYYMDTNVNGENYPNGQSLTRTFTPSEPGKLIRVEFVSFNLQNGYDFLSVYDGADASAPLINHYTYNELENTEFISTAADGSLTFVFTSSSSVTDEGWVAYVDCVNSASTSTNTFNNFKYFPNPANSVINIRASEEITEIKAYAVSGQLLFTRKVNATQAAIDISALANGVYFFKATNDTKETNFRVVKQ